MEILVSLILVVGLIFIAGRHFRKEKNINFKGIVKKTFPKHVIIEKFSTIMICEINHRNEPDELIFIRVIPNKKKSIKKSGKRLIAEYPKPPSAAEMKRDFKDHL